MSIFPTIKVMKKEEEGERKRIFAFAAQKEKREWYDKEFYKNEIHLREISREKKGISDIISTLRSLFQLDF